MSTDFSERVHVKIWLEKIELTRDLTTNQRANWRKITKVKDPNKKKGKKSRDGLVTVSEKLTIILMQIKEKFWLILRFAV